MSLPIVREIERNAKPLADDDDYAGLAIDLADKRIVMLGESTHGTREFYQIRRRLTERLIQDHGFGFVAVEGDWPDCLKLNSVIRSKVKIDWRRTMLTFKRWPTWMWANGEIGRLIDWMSGHGAGFFGLDVYSLYESADILRQYAKKIGGDFADRVERRLNCFESMSRDEVNYAKALLMHHPGCEREVAENLMEILKLRVSDTKLGGEELFDVQQNARIMKNAEAYYRSMLSGEADSWNIRDNHMAETLELLLNRAGPRSKAVVWAHNTHIGDYRFTDMKREGYVNLGGLARRKFGDENVAMVGFSTFAGQVTAARAWGANPEVMTIPEALDQTIERYFHEAAQEMKQNQFYLSFPKNSRFAELGEWHGHRAIGVVYSPDANRRGSYVPTRLSSRYDTFVFTDRTSALTPMAGHPEAGLFPETWPSGQ